MNRDEIIDILTAVQVVDHRTIGEGDITMWGAILADLPKDLALQAVIDHRREQPGVWLEPGHIYNRVRAIRQDRAMRRPLAIEPPHDDERTNQAQLAALLAVSKIGRHDQPPPELGPRSVQCPHCRAEAGRRCVEKSTGRPLTHAPYYHQSRIDTANGFTPLGPARPTTMPLFVTDGVMCPICENELIKPDALTRGICDACLPTVNGPTATPDRNGQTA